MVSNYTAVDQKKKRFKTECAFSPTFETHDIKKAEQIDRGNTSLHQLSSARQKKKADSNDQRK